jgi:carnitine O-palmitoyltransferase 2
LPIPKLDDSCKRYLNSLKPLLNEDDYKRVENLVKNFEKNDGLALDKQIRAADAAKRDSNYINGNHFFSKIERCMYFKKSLLSEAWFDMYLTDRQSIVLNYNPTIAFVPHSQSELMDQAVRTTNFLVSSLRLLKSLRANNLEPEIFHLNPEKSNTTTFKRLMR